MTELEGYVKEVFALIPSLELLDGQDRAGQYVIGDSSEEEADEAAPNEESEDSPASEKEDNNEVVRAAESEADGGIYKELLPQSFVPDDHPIAELDESGPYFQGYEPDGGTKRAPEEDELGKYSAGEGTLSSRCGVEEGSPTKKWKKQLD